MDKTMTDIPKKDKFYGYYWMSDQKKPEVLHGKEFDIALDPGANPFVIEALLFDGKTSYSVKYVDGKYIVVETDLSKTDLDSGTFAKHTFLANRMDKEKKEEIWLKFYQQWVEKEDDLCEGMKVLVPGKLIFAGFVGKEDKQ